MMIIGRLCPLFLSLSPCLLPSTSRNYYSTTLLTREKRKRECLRRSMVLVAPHPRMQGRESLPPAVVFMGLGIHLTIILYHMVATRTPSLLVCLPPKLPRVPPPKTPKMKKHETKQQASSEPRWQRGGKDNKYL